MISSYFSNKKLITIQYSRTKSSTGIWLGPLISLSALFTFLNEDASYSELCLLIGTAGGGLLISCICLYARLTIDSKAVKDFHFLYWIPTILLTLLFLLIGHKGKLYLKNFSRIFKK